MKEVVDSLWSTNFVSWDEKDGDGNTILHLLAAACYYDRFKLLARMLTKDQLTVVNNKNETPAQVAKTCIAGTLPSNLASLGLSKEQLKVFSSKEHLGFPDNYAIIAEIATKCGDEKSVLEAIE